MEKMDKETARLFDAAEHQFRVEFLQDSMTDARNALRSIIRIAKLYPDAQLPTPLAAAILVGAKVVDE